MIKILSYILVAIGFSSCLKELPIPKQETGDVQTIQLNMGETYENQIFYDLESLTIIDIKNKDVWDLAFSCTDTSNHVILNTAKIMGAVHLPNGDFMANPSPSAQTWIYEHPTGDFDKGPFYNWENLGGVYFVNAGMNHLGTQQGYFMVELSLENDQLKVRWRRRNEIQIFEKTISKSSNYNFYALSFSTVDLIECEPPKATWDLVFTVYTHLFNDHDAYAVNGVLLNYAQVQAAKHTGVFEDLTLDFADNLLLSNQRNVIGYDWKEFIMQQNLFTILPNNNYVVKTRSAFLHKLRFTNFYNQQGLKGFPTFEVVSF
jgi:hypothetical protein